MSQVIFWKVLYFDAAQLAELDKTATDFLSAVECRTLSRLVVPKRRSDWLCGRFTAKTLVQQYVGRSQRRAPHLAEIEILAALDGAPGVHLPAAVRGADEPLSISISHSHGACFCALADDGQVSVGADLEYIESRSWTLAQDFFTADEQARVLAASADQRDLMLTAIWSAKEAVLKAQRVGLREDTRRINCRLGFPSESWQPFALVSSPDCQEIFTASWWRVDGSFVLALVARTKRAFGRVTESFPLMEALS